MIAHAKEHWARWSTHYWVALAVALCGAPAGLVGILTCATGAVVVYAARGARDGWRHWRIGRAFADPRDRRSYRWRWVALDSVVGDLGGPVLVWLQAYALLLVGS